MGIFVKREKENNIRVISHMFRKTSHQISLFEVDNVFSGILPAEDWCYIYKEDIYPIIDEEKFRHIYKETPTGQPNKSIKRMLSLLIFMGLEKLTWRGAEFQFPRRIDWMIATNTEIGKANNRKNKCSF